VVVLPKSNLDSLSLRQDQATGNPGLTFADDLTTCSKVVERSGCSPAEPYPLDLFINIDQMWGVSTEKSYRLGASCRRLAILVRLRCLIWPLRGHYTGSTVESQKVQKMCRKKHTDLMQTHGPGFFLDYPAMSFRRRMSPRASKGHDGRMQALTLPLSGDRAVIFGPLRPCKPSKHFKKPSGARTLQICRRVFEDFIRQFRK